MHLNWVLRQRPDIEGPPGRRQRQWRWLAVAAALTAVPPVAAAGYPAAATGGTAGPASATGPLNCAPPGVKLLPCYSPQAYQVAYGVSPLLRGGIAGSDQPVANPQPAA